MNKKIILCGDGRTGKTVTAFIMQLAYNNVFVIEARKNVDKKNPHFIYDGVSEKTDLIIIDDVTPDKFTVFETLIYTDEIQVETRGKNPFLVKVPDVIITFDGNPDFFKNYGVSFLHRCKIIECSKDGHLFLHKEVKFHNTVNQLIN